MSHFLPFPSAYNTLPKYRILGDQKFLLSVHLFQITRIIIAIL